MKLSEVITQISGYTLRTQTVPFQIWEGFYCLVLFCFLVQGTEDNFGSLPRALIFQLPQSYSGEVILICSHSVLPFLEVFLMVCC